MGTITTTTNNIFKSRLPDIHLSNQLPLHKYLFENATPFSPCIISEAMERTYSYMETQLLCHKTATFLSDSCQIKNGHVVQLLLPNCPEFVFFFLAASILGAIASPVDPDLTPDDIKVRILSTGATVIITKSCYINKIPNNIKNLIVVAIDNSSISFEIERSIPINVSADVKPDDAVAFMFTSGTTGVSKAVVLTHKSMVSSIAQQVDGEDPNMHIEGEGGGDIILCLVPLYHIFALNAVFIGMRAGAAVVVMERYKGDVGRMLAAIQKWKVTVAMLVPPLILAVAKYLEKEYDLETVRMVFAGAAPIGKELEVAFRKKMPRAVLGQAYGMTEAGPVISLCPGFTKKPFPIKPGSCGIVVRNANLKVMDINSGLSLGRNQLGEICICGPQIMQGYLIEDPETNPTMKDAEGWLHTGDAGYIDEDDEIFVVDRVKELINFNGYQVPPAELEALLLSHPSIADAAVIPQKDEDAGEIPVGFIVPSKDSNLTEEAVKEFISKQVAVYKRLQKVYFIDAIPKTPSGKILRKDLKARVATSYY